MDQLGELETLVSEFESREAQLIAIAYQSEADAAKSVEKSGATFPILADVDRQVVDLYGVYGLETSQANKTVPAVFVIDQTGDIHWAYVGKYAADRPKAQLILKSAEVVSGVTTVPKVGRISKVFQENLRDVLHKVSVLFYLVAIAIVSNLLIQS